MYGAWNTFSVPMCFKEHVDTQKPTQQHYSKGNRNFDQNCCLLTLCTQLQLVTPRLPFLHKMSQSFSTFH